VFISITAASGQYKGRRRNVFLAVVIAMWISSTMHAALQWFLYSNAINENEGTSGTQLINTLSTIAPWLEATGSTFFCLNIFMADCLFVRLIFM
jgi:hypothetical protein